MVQEIISFKSQFQLDVFGDGGVFKDRKIKLAERRADQGVAPFISEMTSPWDAGGRGTVPASRWKTTGSRERAEVEILSRVVLMVDNWTNNIGAPKELAAAIKILREEIIHAEGLAGLHSDDAIETPAIDYTLPVTFAIGKLIDEIPGEAVANVEV